MKFEVHASKNVFDKLLYDWNINGDIEVVNIVHSATLRLLTLVFLVRSGELSIKYIYVV